MTYNYLVKLYWKPEKNDKLKNERNVSFEDIEEAISDGGLMAILENSNYADQIVLVVSFENEIWAVPATERKGLTVLWTAFPSRKLRKIYGSKKNEKKNSKK